MRPIEKRAFPAFRKVCVLLLTLATSFASAQSFSIRQQVTPVLDEAFISLYSFEKTKAYCRSSDKECRIAIFYTDLENPLFECTLYAAPEWQGILNDLPLLTNYSASGARLLSPVTGLLSFSPDNESYLTDQCTFILKKIGP